MDNPNQPNSTNSPAPSMPPIPTTEEGGTPPPMPTAGVGIPPSDQGSSAPQNPDSDGSVAAGLNIPPIVTTPKKKFGGGKVIATILGLLLLVGGIGAGVVLVQQRQLFQQKAAADVCFSSGMTRCKDRETMQVCSSGSWYDSRCSSGQACINTTCITAPTTPGCTTSGATQCKDSNTLQVCSSGSWHDSACPSGQSCSNGTCAGGSATAGGCSATKVQECQRNNQDCVIDSSGNEQCTGGGGGEINQPPDIKPCPGTDNIKCETLEVCRGANKKIRTDLTGCNPNPPTYQVCCESISAGSVCAGVQCSGNGCSVAGTLPPTASDTGCFVNHYWCQTRSPSGCSSNKIKDRVTSSSFEKDCGTEQIDIYCPSCNIGGNIASGLKYISKTYTSDCGGGGGEESAQCSTIKVYDTNWSQLTMAQLSALTAGTTIRITVIGTATSGVFDKAQFTVNGTALPETTTKKPGSEEFYSEYVIPDAVTSFTINGKLHHSTLNWF